MSEQEDIVSSSLILKPSSTVEDFFNGIIMGMIKNGGDEASFSHECVIHLANGGKFKVTLHFDITGEFASCAE